LNFQGEQKGQEEWKKVPFFLEGKRGSKTKSGSPLFRTRLEGATDEFDPACRLTSLAGSLL